MGDFPEDNGFPSPGDLDDDCERQFQDELELLRESEEHKCNGASRNTGNPVRRSLHFSSPSVTHEPIDDVGDEKYGVAVDAGEAAAHKRTVDELFGDTSDLEAEEAARGKRRRVGERGGVEEGDADVLLTARLLRARRARRQLTVPAVAATAAAYEPTHNLSYDIPRWAFVGVTRGDGARVYVRLAAEEEAGEARGEEAGCLSDHLRAVYGRVWDDARALLEKKLVSEAVQNTKEGNNSAAMEQAEPAASELWVERYRPRHYRDLLSAEPDNRAALHWLKLWDQIVFNRELKRKEPAKATSFNRRAGAWEARAAVGRGGGGRGGAGRGSAGAQAAAAAAEEEEEVDARGRPRRPLLLLCGPPGAGKTTLAHLIATHAGYRPLEVNASDERSVEAFRTVLHNATDMQPTLHADRRPNCVILDEVDGAPLPAVEFLVKFATGAPLAGGGVGKKRPHVLRRPIICICNDPWVPSLRPLRAVARVVHLAAAGGARLAARLAEVAEQQGLKVETPVLAALAAHAAGDVRAALATLYFLSKRLHHVRGAEAIRLALASGQRDASKGVMHVLQQVLYSEGDADFHTLLDTVSAAGDYERLAQGVFENYLTVGGARADELPRVSAALDWFRWHDALLAHINCTQNYALYPHLPLAALRWRRLLAAPARARPHQHYLKFPTHAQEVWRQQQASEAAVSAVRSGAAAALRPYASRAALALDLLPLLPHVLAPALRSHNLQLCSERERAELASAVRAMCDYGLTYEQTRAADGTYHYTLQPDIARVAFFEGCGGGPILRRLGYALLQTLAREVQLEQMRRSELKVTGAGAARAGAPAGAPAAPAGAPAAPAALPNHLQRLQPRRIESAAPASHKDFFGRVVSGAAGGALHNGAGGGRRGGGRGGGDVIASSTIYYQYREGFNNAVRRAVKLRDLL